MLTRGEEEVYPIILVIGYFFRVGFHGNIMGLFTICDESVSPKNTRTKNDIE